MKTSVKCIIKWALICEIIVAIIGELGEFVLRSGQYIDFFHSYNVPEFDIYSILIAIIVVFLVINLVFVVAVACEMVLMIILVNVVWAVQLCLNLTIIYPVIQPSVFTMVIIAIVVALSLIYISLIADERNVVIIKRNKRQKTPIKLINVNDLDDL